MSRKIVIIFVAAFASVFGAVACSGEVQVEEPDEVPVKVQDGGEQQKEQPQQQQKQQDQPQQKQEKEGAEGKEGVDTK
jgi:hypothetical protein